MRGASIERAGPDPDADLEEVVRRLRREVRVLRWAGVAVAVVALAASSLALYAGRDGLLSLVHSVSSGDRGVTKLEANEFGMYSRQGDRVMYGYDDKFGYPNLVFLDLKKNYRMAVKVFADGDGTPGLVFYDATGVRGNLRLEPGGVSALNLFGDNGKGGIALAVKADGTPSLKMTDKAGTVLLELPAAKP